MSHDELRKRAFDLECSLGTAMKLCDELRDELMKANGAIKKMSDCNEILIKSVKGYLDTMDKAILLNGVNEAVALAKTFRK